MRARIASFSISRAGAIAAIAGTRQLQRVLPLTYRLALLIGGAIAIGIGAATTISTGLGPGPFDVLVTGISHQSGLSFALSLWLLAAVLGLASALLGKRPGLGTVVAPLIIGPVIDLMSGVVGPLLPTTIDGPMMFASVALVHLFGVVVIGFGAGAMITSGLGAGTGDMLATATSSKLGRSMPVVRTALEISFLGFGLILGGVAGLGTVLVALTIGPAVRFGTKQVDSAMARLSNAVVDATGTESVIGRSLLNFRGVR